LSYNTRESDLQKFFEKYGNVTRVKILMREDGKSKGIGFVTFEKNPHAKNAMSYQDNLELDGR
jgi:RNA recognition motif-containing protein